MSFSSGVKDEISRELSHARHCQIAELSVLLGLCGEVIYNSMKQMNLKIVTENLAVARKVFTLLGKAYKILPEISVSRRLKKQNCLYLIWISNHEDVLRILRATKLLSKNEDDLYKASLVNPVVIQQTCCKRGFLRGAFLSIGFMSDPEKGYHFEMVCTTFASANQIKEVMDGFDLEAKIIPRKNTWVVYLKEGSSIVDALNVMEAHIALMELENIRILREMRNTVNRKVNCETANINKTVSAAVKQKEDIEYLQRTRGLETLPKNLEEIARIRLLHPEATLKELGEFLTPAVGKSGVNHRLRKLSELAEEEREEKRDD